MAKKAPQSLLMKIPAAEAFLRLAPMFVGQGAQGLGMDEAAAEEMALAAEEIIAYLVRRTSPGGEVEIRCFAGSHFVQVDFSFPLEPFDLRAFNMTASLDEEFGMEGMELLIASRMADRFRLSRRPSGNAELTLIKEFPYPERSLDPDAASEAPGAVPLLSRFTVQEPDDGQLKWFLRLVRHRCQASAFPSDFLAPGKIIDMAAAGDYRLLVAVGPAGELGGGIAWKATGERMVEFFGPYVFDQQQTSMAGELLEACIARVARTSALILIHRMATPGLPEGYLESLGVIGMSGGDGRRQQINAFFRELHEDMGAVSWAHAELHEYLVKQYQRLCFPREIRLVAADGEADDAFSVLSAEIDRRLSQVTMRPVWPGRDRLDNLRKHVDLLQREGLAGIFFELDLGAPRQAEFGPALLQLGFIPRILLPHAGAGDLLIFELTDGKS